MNAKDDQVEIQKETESWMAQGQPYTAGAHISEMWGIEVTSCFRPTNKICYYLGEKAFLTNRVIIPRKQSQSEQRKPELPSLLGPDQESVSILKQQI